MRFAFLAASLATIAIAVAAVSAAPTVDVGPDHSSANLAIRSPVDLNDRNLISRAPASWSLNITEIGKGVCFLEEGLHYNGTQVFFNSSLGKSVSSWAATKLNISNLETALGLNCSTKYSWMPDSIMVILGLQYISEGLDLKDLSTFLNSLNKNATKTIESVVKISTVKSTVKTH